MLFRNRVMHTKIDFYILVKLHTINLLMTKHADTFNISQLLHVNQYS